MAHNPAKTNRLQFHLLPLVVQKSHTSHLNSLSTAVKFNSSIPKQLLLPQKEDKR